MADTTTTRRPARRTDDDHPDTTGRTPSMSTTDKPNGDTGGSKNDPPATAQEPAPATSYAGSGTVEPIELSPETHGRHFRGSTGDV